MINRIQLAIIMLLFSAVANWGCNSTGSENSVNPDSDMDSDGNTDTDNDTGTDPDNDVDTDTDTDSDADTDSDTDTDSDASTDSDTYSDTGTGLDTDAPPFEHVDACLEGAAANGTMTETVVLNNNYFRVGFVRYDDPEMMGTSGTTPWLGERFALVSDLIDLCVTSPGDLNYQSSYHNFMDSFEITHGGSVYTLDMARPEGYNGPVIWTLSATGTDQLGDISLNLDSCEELLYGGECVTRYQ